MNSYIISLSKIPLSRDSALEVFKSLEEFNLNPVLFEGTYGNDAEKLFQNTKRILHQTHEDNNNLKLSSPGVKGCFMSHYRLWELCVEKNEPIMIFEDDVIFFRNYKPIEFKDLLILSLNYDWKLTIPYRKYLEDSVDITDALEYHLDVMPGTSGYIIKPNAAKLLLNEYKNSYLPADIAMNKKIIDIQIHPNLMGRSKMLDEKQSLTRFKEWL